METQQGPCLLYQSLWTHFFLLIQVIIFLFLSSIQHLAFVFYCFVDKILKLKFNSNCPQEANNVVFAAILLWIFQSAFLTEIILPYFLTFVRYFASLSFSSSPSDSLSPLYLLMHILTVTFFSSTVGRICFTLFLLLVIYFHPNLLVLLEVSLHSRIN